MTNLINCNLKVPDVSEYLAAIISLLPKTNNQSSSLTYSISVNVTGLTGTGLTLQNNSSDTLSITSNGSFSFSQKLAAGQIYSILVTTQPTTPVQTCTITGGSGTVINSDVTGIMVTCTNSTFTVGGTITGATGTLVLQNNGGDNFTTSTNGAFTFATPVTTGTTYNVIVFTQPPGQTCIPTGGTGTVANGNITTVSINCTTTSFSLGGTVTGLLGSGFILKTASGLTQSITANGAFAFSTLLPDFSGYNVSVDTPPSSPAQVCTITNNVGEIATANVTNLLVNCVRVLNSSKFNYAGEDKIWTSGVCGVTDQPTGIGPFNFTVDAANDDVLITSTSNLYITNAICDFANQSELSLFVDGVKQQTSTYNRCWGQTLALTTAFVMPSMSSGTHSLELRYCGNGTRIPAISGAYSNILTATSLQSSSYYEGRASSILPVGTTTLTASAPFLPILNGGVNMAVSYTATNNVNLWQNLSLGGLQLNGSILRLDPITTEDWTMSDDGHAPMSMFTHSPLAASSGTTITAQYSSAAGNSIITKSPFDNTLNAIAFKTPLTSNHGKTVFSGTASEGSGVITPLISIPITAPGTFRYLISFTANYAYGNSTGNGCDFLLFINNAQTAKVPLVSSSGPQTLESSLITVESVDAGTSIPVEIRFNRSSFGTCNVHRAVLSVLPLE